MADFLFKHKASVYMIGTVNTGENKLEFCYGAVQYFRPHTVVYGGIAVNRGYIYIFFATLFFSSMEVALKPVATVFHPMQMNCTRFLVGGILLIPLAMRALQKRKIKLVPRDWLEFAWLGFIGLVVSMMLFQISVMHIPASAVSVLFSCNPVMVVPLAFLLLHTDIRPQHVIALVLEVVAALVIIDPLHGNLNFTGVAAVIASAVLFALYAVLGKRQSARVSGVAVTCFSSLAGSAEMLILMGLSHLTPVAESLNRLGWGMFAAMPFADGYTIQNLPIVAYICVAVTAGGYACYFMGMEATSPIRGSLVFFFKPILAPILAMVVLGERIPWNMWCGIVIMLCASFISMIPSVRETVRIIFAAARFRKTPL